MLGKWNRIKLEDIEHENGRNDRTNQVYGWSGSEFRIRWMPTVFFFRPRLYSDSMWSATLSVGAVGAVAAVAVMSRHIKINYDFVCAYLAQASDIQSVLNRLKFFFMDFFFPWMRTMPERWATDNDLETKWNQFERKMLSDFDYHIKSASNVIRIWQIMLWACFVNELTWKIGSESPFEFIWASNSGNFRLAALRSPNQYSIMEYTFSIVVNSMRETSATDTHRLQCELIVPRRCIRW